VAQSSRNLLLPSLLEIMVELLMCLVNSGSSVGFTAGDNVSGAFKPHFKECRILYRGRKWSS
jgi:hypothetical protein